VPAEDVDGSILDRLNLDLAHVEADPHAQVRVLVHAVLNLDRPLNGDRRPLEERDQPIARRLAHPAAAVTHDNVGDEAVMLRRRA
jgi:hypothetical protein